MITDEQREQRRTGLGSSDAAGVLGLDPWRTRLDVWRSKLESLPPDKTTALQYWGNKLERVVIEAAAEREGWAVDFPDTYRHPHLPMMLANIDGRVDEFEAVIEAKTIGRKTDEWGEEGTDQIPIHIAAQACHQMACTGLIRVYVPVLFMLERRLEIYHLERDDTLIAALEAAEARFWADHVLTRLAPAPTTAADVAALWRHDDGGIVEASPAAFGAVERLREVRAAQKALADERDSLEITIKKELESSATLMGPGGEILCTWKTQKARRFDSQAFRQAHATLWEQYRHDTTSRVLRLK